MVDYSLWEVIENGNAPPITKCVKGVETFEPPLKCQVTLTAAAIEREVLDQTFDRLQKLISQLEIHGEITHKEDVKQKVLKKSITIIRTTHTIIEEQA
ncbi:hypothetical protein Tco_1448293 [Tanacetum coccineum]